MIDLVSNCAEAMTGMSAMMNNKLSAVLPQDIKFASRTGGKLINNSADFREHLDSARPPVWGGRPTEWPSLMIFACALLLRVV